MPHALAIVGFERWRGNAFVCARIYNQPLAQTYRRISMIFCRSKNGGRGGVAPVMYPGERFNSISHLVGAVLALTALVVLVVMGSAGGDPWKVVSFIIYGGTLFVLYLVSTLYHSLKGRPKLVLKILDHHATYLLIAGTYTPFALVVLRDSVG
jgi:predicted membrane channel-forming protein YqfA (hemolysin III family)